MSRAEISRLMSGCGGLFLFNEGAGATVYNYGGLGGNLQADPNASPWVGKYAGGMNQGGICNFENANHRVATSAGLGWRTKHPTTDAQNHFIYLPSKYLRPHNPNWDFSVITKLSSDTTTAHDTFGWYPGPSPAMAIYPASQQFGYGVLGSSDAGQRGATYAQVGGIYTYGASARYTCDSTKHSYEMFFNGVKVKSGTLSVGAANPWHIPFIGTYGVYTPGNVADYMTFYFFGFWDRILSAEEHRLISEIAHHDREMFMRNKADAFYIPPSFRPAWIRQQCGAIIGGR